MDISCPKCGSHDLHAEKSTTMARPSYHDGKGHETFGVTNEEDIEQRLNQIIITCLACGHQFYPGKDHLPVEWGLPKWQYKLARIVALIVAGIFGLISLISLASGAFGMFIAAILLGALFTIWGLRSKKHYYNN